MTSSPSSSSSSSSSSRAQDAKGLAVWARYTGLGMQFALAIALPTVGGYFLDRWLDTLPLFLLVLALLGAVAGGVLLVRATKPGAGAHDD